MFHITIHPAAAGVTIDVYPMCGWIIDLLLMVGLRLLICALRDARLRPLARAIIRARRTAGRGGRRSG